MSERLFEHLTNEEKERIMSSSNILYLVLFYFDSKDESKEDTKDWEMITGRQEVYDHIKNLLKGETVEDEFTLNVDKSLIYADNPNIPDENNKLRISKGISIYKFMRDCTAKQKVVEDRSFSIEDYHFEGDEEEDDVKKVM